MTHAELTWKDRNGRTWDILLESGAITLRDAASELRIPKERWNQDVLITPYDTTIGIRFDTFDHTIAFQLSPTAAAPLLEHVRRSTSPTAAEPEPIQRQAAVLWPKVSPFAVWSLICAALAFVPLLGILATISGVILLVLHRSRVPQSPEWAHSRIICMVSMAFLIVGVPINVAATWNAYANIRTERVAPETNKDVDALSVLPDSKAMRQLNSASAMKEPLDRHGSVLAQSQPTERSIGMIAASLIVLLLSLTVHEAGHAISAWWLGDDFARRLGRVTLNPLAHIDPFGTVLLPLLLYMAGAPMFGWAKSVPVRTEVLQRPRRGHILISLAGPGANLLLAAASLMAMLGVGCAVSLFAPSGEIRNFNGLELHTAIHAEGFLLAPLVGPACTVFMLSFVLNVFLAFFNLIPLPPLDGSWVLEKLFPRTLGPIYERIRPYGFLIFVIVLYSNAFDYLILPAFYAILPGVILLNWCTPF